MLHIIEFFVTIAEKLLGIFGKVREYFGGAKKYHLECFFVIFKEITDNFEDDYYYEETKALKNNYDLIFKNILNASLRNVLYFKVKNYLKSYIKQEQCRKDINECLKNFINNFSVFLENELLILGYKDVYNEFLKIVKDNEIHYINLDNINHAIDYIKKNTDKIEKILEDYKTNLVFALTIINPYERIIENVCLKNKKNLKTCALIYIFMNISMIIALNKYFFKSIMQKYDL